MSITYKPFTPAAIPGCLLWADASDRTSIYQSTNLTSTVVADGQFVGSWLDKSGNNRSFTQTTASYRPFFSSSGLFFSTSAAHLLFGSLPNSANQEVYSVSRSLNSATTRTLYTCAQRDEKPLFVDAGNNAGFFTRLLFANYGYGFTLPPTSRFITGVSLQYQGGFLSWYPIAERNSSNFSATSGNIYADRSLYSLGNNWSNLSEPYGEVNEIAVYNRFLSAGERYTLEAYFANKWGISANLSASNTQLTKFTNPTRNILTMANVVPVIQKSVFLGTGAVQTFTVPAGVFALRFIMWGAGGGSFGSGEAQRSGSGGYTEGNLLVSPGTVLYIIVGRTAQTGLANGAPGAGYAGATGGGFSGIFSGSPAANNVIAIAGGGGGGGIVGAGYGGAGGYPNGLDATGSAPGLGGTQSAGGVAPGGGVSGSQLQGGGGGGTYGGGGGGWYGGSSGGFQGGGGGGSSTYIGTVINPVTFNGNSGTGAASFTVPRPAPNESSPYWISPYGRSQNDGLVVIGYSPATPPNLLNYTSYTGPFKNSSSFLGTGTVQSFTVPAGVTVVRFFCWGSGGQGQNGVNPQIAGSGAYMAASFVTTPGTVFYIVVGRPGQTGIANGGGSIGGNSANGGGFSGIFSGSSPSEYNTLLIAGAGGGSGTNGGGNGGGGGYPNGLNGSTTQGIGIGTGGTQTAGGSGSTNGTQLAGGTGTGGGGGGGWWGGGGGYFFLSSSGGGGGSGYVSAQAKAFESVNGNNGGTNGANPTLAGNESSPYWQSPYGRGGQNGLVVVAY